MVTQELLRKLKAQDLSASNQLYDQYGWYLHNYLRENCPDKEMASEAFSKAMHRFCADLTAHPGTDVMELVLRVYADQALLELKDGVSAPEAVPAVQEASKADKTRPGIGQILLMLLLLFVVLAALWVILGKVMGIELIPGLKLDLGYSWFNRNIAPWF